MYKYMWLDSVAKITVLLVDRSGLRKKGSIPQDPDKKVEHLDDKKVKNVLAMFGIGTDVPDESEEQKAERIRNELNN